MARNVQAFSVKLVTPGESLAPESPPVPVVQTEGKAPVTFLRRLLNDVSIETMLQAVQSLNLSINITTSGMGVWSAHIKGHGTLSYHAGGAKSPRMALANAFAEFFINEKRDIHEYPNFAKKKGE